MLTYLNCYSLNLMNNVSAGKNRTHRNCHFSCESESVRKTVKCLHWLSTRSNGSQRVSAAVESKRCQLDPSRRHPYCKSCPQRHSHLQRQLTPQLRTDHFFLACSAPLTTQCQNFIKSIFKLHFNRHLQKQKTSSFPFHD